MKKKPHTRKRKEEKSKDHSWKFQMDCLVAYLPGQEL